MSYDICGLHLVNSVLGGMYIHCSCTEPASRYVTMLRPVANNIICAVYLNQSKTLCQISD